MSEQVIKMEWNSGLDSRLLCLPVEQQGLPHCSMVRGTETTLDHQNPEEWNGMRLLGLSASLLAGGQLVKPENPRSGADPRKVQM